MDRPKVIIPLDKEASILKIVSLIAVMLIGVSVSYYYPLLPQEVPSHFGLTGAADDYSGKSIVLVVAAMAVILFLMLEVFTKYPHKFNYPIRITSQNAVYYYGLAIKMTRYLNMIMSIIFFYLILSISRTALGHQEGLNPYVMGVLLFTVIGVVVYYTIKMYQKMAV